MAIFLSKAQVLTIGGTDVTRIVSVDVDINMDVVRAAIVDGTWEELAEGYKTATMTVNLAPQASDTALLGLFDVGDNGAIVWQPDGAGSTKMQFDATECIVTSVRNSGPVNGYFSTSVTLQLNDAAWSAQV